MAYLKNQATIRERREGFLSIVGDGVMAKTGRPHFATPTVIEVADRGLRREIGLAGCPTASPNDVAGRPA